MQEFDIPVETERYIRDQVRQVSDVLLRGVPDFDAYNQYVGMARAYGDILAHINELRKRRAEDNEEDDA